MKHFKTGGTFRSVRKKNRVKDARKTVKTSTRSESRLGGETSSGGGKASWRLASALSTLTKQAALMSLVCRSRRAVTQLPSRLNKDGGGKRGQGKNKQRK